ncbi:MAG: glycine cleavage T C-terminal barrel domain-containing protein, partial [Alistipes sp.]
DFIDRAYMTQLKADGAKRKLVGFKMIDRGIPRHGYTLAAPTGEEIGHVTSGTMSPCMKIGFGMGYVKAEYAKAGTEIAVVIRDRKLKAEVVKIPFV